MSGWVSIEEDFSNSYLLVLRLHFWLWQLWFYTNFWACERECFFEWDSFLQLFDGFRWSFSQAVTLLHDTVQMMMITRLTRYAHIAMMMGTILSALTSILMTCCRFHGLTHHLLSKVHPVSQFACCNATLSSCTLLKACSDHSIDDKIYKMFETALRGSKSHFILEVVLGILIISWWIQLLH